MVPYITNKWKIINDPVYGFIRIQSDLVFDLLQHPFFQRLRRIRQLGLTNFVYPGATHTRFQHALGALHLMYSALQTLRSKGIEISKEEEEAVSVAILLHDIGHGPFSHALESSLISEIRHEKISSLFMYHLNQDFGGALELAIDIFHDRYPKRFLHQLVSSQLDMDRLDYLRRDSFFTGVTEGTIGSDRIIKMLHVVNDSLVVEAKGIYSIEKYLVARRFMFWQVYLHKTVISAEQLLVRLLLRAKELARQGGDLFASPALAYFLKLEYTGKEISDALPGPVQKELLHHFSMLDDNDIITSAKVWTNHKDRILSALSRRLIHRNLLGIMIQNKEFSKKLMKGLKEKMSTKERIALQDTDYFIFTRSISNDMYDIHDDIIQILRKDGRLSDITEISDVINTRVLSSQLKKHFLCYPKEYHTDLIKLQNE